MKHSDDYDGAPLPPWVYFANGEETDDPTIADRRECWFSAGNDYVHQARNPGQRWGDLTMQYESEPVPENLVAALRQRLIDEAGTVLAGFLPDPGFAPHSSEHPVDDAIDAWLEGDRRRAMFIVMIKLDHGDRSTFAERCLDTPARIATALGHAWRLKSCMKLAYPICPYCGVRHWRPGL